jgi:hypothetical protein
MRWDTPVPHTPQPVVGEPRRYRLMFEGDHTLRPAGRADWWRLRPPLGHHPAPDDVAHRRRIGDTT